MAEGVVLVEERPHVGQDAIITEDRQNRRSCIVLQAGEAKREVDECIKTICALR